MKDTWNNIKLYFKKNKKQAIAYLVFTICVYVLLFALRGLSTEKIEEVSYTEFQNYLNDGAIDTVYYNSQSEYMTFTLLNDETKDMSLEDRAKYEYSAADTRTCLYPAYDEFRKDVLATGTNMVAVSNTSALEAIYVIVQILFPVLMLFLIFGAMKGQARGLSEKEMIQTSEVKFDDIIGHDEIIDDVKFITELIKDPSKGDKVGAKLPKGALFIGPPGTGKTLLAKAIAHEAGVPFLYINTSSFIEMYVGLGAKRVRDAFRIARKNAPCILFLDEIDSIGEKRGSSKGTSENDQTITAFLQEMDGFTGREGVFIIAATNRPEVLDDALVRSGRFDRKICVNPPKDWRVRAKLFEHYLEKFTVSDDIDIENLSKQVSGFTGADIAMICNEASIIAVMHDKECIDHDCLEEAIDKKVFNGNRSKTDEHEIDKRIVAYHESGHAIMSHLLGEPIARASIQSTISGVGGAVFNQDKDTLFQTDEDFRHSIMIAYAGRASEEIKFDNVTTGASNDISKATELMTAYIEKFGFDKDFGLLDIGVLAKQHLVDSDIVTDKLSAMSVELYSQTKELLSKHYELVERLATKLLEVETLSGNEIAELLK